MKGKLAITIAVVVLFVAMVCCGGACPYDAYEGCEATMTALSIGLGTPAP